MRVNQQSFGFFLLCLIGLASPVFADSVAPVSIATRITPPVDVIFVVDNSGSMDEEIAQVRANINQYFADILSASGLDYQVIMISRRSQVCVAPPLGGPDCSDNPPLYRAIDQVVGSTNSLSLILSTYDSANPFLNWSTSLRYDAVKVFIEVTDDDSALSALQFATLLLAKQPAGMFGTAERNYVFHSIIGVTPGNPNITCSTAANEGSQYQTLSNLTGGGLYSVCASDYSPILSEIANGIVGAIDTTPPETTITGGPTGTIAVDSASFTWTGTDNVSQVGKLLYAYRLDPAEGSFSAFGSATSRSYAGLANGNYTFYVKARDEAGNEDPTPTSRSFTVQLPILVVIRAGTGSGTVISNPTGIDCGADCSEAYNVGTPVTLTATPAVGSVFAGWSGGGCSGTGACAVTMTANTTVTAAFELRTFTLTVVGVGTGSGTVTSNPAGIDCGADCSEAYTAGTVVTLTATAAAGSVFAGWSGEGCSGTGACTVTMTQARSVTATFNPAGTLGVTLATNTTTFRTGDSLIIWVGVDNPGLASTVDFYFGALLPNGDTVVFFTDLAFNSGVGSLASPATLRPIVAGVDLAAPFVFSNPAFFMYRWVGMEPAGSYVLFLAAVRPGALADNFLDPGDIVALATAVVTFTP